MLQKAEYHVSLSRFARYMCGQGRGTTVPRHHESVAFSAPLQLLRTIQTKQLASMASPPLRSDDLLDLFTAGLHAVCSPSRRSLASKPSSSPWSELPEDILGLVLARLPNLADRARFQAVCRSWRSSAPPPPQLPWMQTVLRSWQAVSSPPPWNWIHSVCRRSSVHSHLPQRPWIVLPGGLYNHDGIYTYIRECTGHG